MTRKGKFINGRSVIYGEVLRDGPWGTEVRLEDFSEMFLDTRNWEFIEDKPTALEQFRALPIGAKFKVSMGSGWDDSKAGVRIKLRDTHYAFVYSDDREADPIVFKVEHWVKDWEGVEAIK